MMSVFCGQLYEMSNFLYGDAEMPLKLHSSLTVIRVSEPQSFSSCYTGLTIGLSPIGNIVRTSAMQAHALLTQKSGLK